jgi:hypothetical protein
VHTKKGLIIDVFQEWIYTRQEIIEIGLLGGKNFLVPRTKESF